MKTVVVSIKTNGSNAELVTSDDGCHNLGQNK